MSCRARTSSSCPIQNAPWRGYLNSRDTGRTTSQENVELVRAASTARFGGDEWLAWVDEFVAPTCEIEDWTLPEAATGLRGPAAARAEAAQMLEAFEEVDYVVEDLRDLDDRVAVRVRGFGRGRGSGLRVDGTLGHVWMLRGAKVVRFDVYGTWDEALEAVGLQE